MGLNEFADWSPAERRRLRKRQKHLGILVPDTPRSRRRRSLTWRTVDAADGGRLAHEERLGLMGRVAVAARPRQHAGVVRRVLGLLGDADARGAPGDRDGEARAPSAQSLLDCVDNQLECGGKGGCDGAIEELGYEHAKAHGVPLEDDYAYTARDGTCNTTVEPPSSPTATSSCRGTRRCRCSARSRRWAPSRSRWRRARGTSTAAASSTAARGTRAPSRTTACRRSGTQRTPGSSRTRGAPTGARKDIYLSRANDASAARHRPQPGGRLGVQGHRRRQVSRDGRSARHVRLPPPTRRTRRACAPPTGCCSGSSGGRRARRLAAADAGRGEEAGGAGRLMPK